MKFLFVFALMMFAIFPARAADDLMGVYQSYEGDTLTSLDQAHRSINELGMWLSDTVADALEFTPGDTTRKLNAIRPYFSEQGYKAYLDFMAAQGLAEGLQKQTLNLTSIVNSTPILIGQGASAGRYAWAYEMSVVLSNTVGAAENPVSATVTLRVQIGRSAKAPAPNNVLIESWQALAASAPDAGGKPATTP